MVLIVEALEFEAFCGKVDQKSDRKLVSFKTVHSLRNVLIAELFNCIQSEHYFILHEEVLVLLSSPS